MEVLALVHHKIQESEYQPRENRRSWDCNDPSGDDHHEM